MEHELSDAQAREQAEEFIDDMEDEEDHRGVADVSFNTVNRTLSSSQLMTSTGKLTSVSDPVLSSSKSDDREVLGWLTDHTYRSKSAPCINFVVEVRKTPSDVLLHGERHRNRRLSRRDTHRVRSARVSVAGKIESDAVIIPAVPEFQFSVTERHLIDQRHISAELDVNSHLSRQRPSANDRSRGRSVSWAGTTPYTLLESISFNEDFQTDMCSSSTGTNNEDVLDTLNMDLDWSWSAISSNKTMSLTESLSESSVEMLRKVKSEPSLRMVRGFAKKSSIEKKNTSLPDLRACSTPSLSELEFAHIASRDEGDVGGLEDTSEDLSDTQAEAGTTSTDNDDEVLELELNTDGGESEMSSWSDLSLIVEGITVRRAVEKIKPYLVTELSKAKRTKSSQHIKHPYSRLKFPKRSYSDNELHNKWSEKYYRDCILPDMASDQTHAESPFRIFVTEPLALPYTLATGAGGGGFDPSDSSDDEQDTRSMSPKKPWRSPRKSPYKSRDKLSRDHWPFNIKRSDPPKPRYWTKPKRKPPTLAEDTNSLQLSGKLSLDLASYRLPVLPPIAARRPPPDTGEVENLVAQHTIPHISYFMDRHLLYNSYIQTIDLGGSSLSQLSLTKSVNKLRIKPSAGTVKPLHADEVHAIEYPRSSDQSSDWKMDSAAYKGKQLSTDKLEALSRTKRLEQLIKSNSEKKGGRAMYGLKLSQGRKSVGKAPYRPSERVRSQSQDEVPRLKIEAGHEGIITVCSSISRDQQVRQLQKRFNIMETYTIDNSNLILCGPRLMLTEILPHQKDLTSIIKPH